MLVPITYHEAPAVLRLYRELYIFGLFSDFDTIEVDKADIYSIYGNIYIVYISHSFSVE